MEQSNLLKILSQHKYVIALAIIVPLVAMAAVIPTDLTVTGDLDVQNIQIDGDNNTIKSTDTNGDIILDPNGSGNINLPDLSASRVPLIDSGNDLVSSNVTETEFSQLENIGSTTISSTQWGYLGALDQALTQSDDVGFNSVLVGDGSESAPSYSFADETNMGFFRESGGGQIGVSMGGSKGACFTESDSGSTNFGVGLCSTSDATPFYLYRSSTSSVQMQIENPATTAGAGAGVTFKSGTGNTSNLLAYPTAMTLVALKDRAALRNFVGDGVSIIATEASADTRFYFGGQTDADELMRFDDAGVVFDFDGSISPDSSLAFEVTGTTTQGAKPAPTLTESQRDAVSSPASGAMVYNSDSNKYNYYNGSSWSDMGGGAGSGEKTYFEGGDFESGVGLATAYEEGSAAYADGTGGSPATISVSQNSTTPLRQLADLAITKAATDGSAEGVTLLSQSIERADQGRELYFKGEFDFTGSNYTSGDICLKAYDVADTAILAVVPVSGLDEDGCFNQAKGKVVAKVLTSASTTGAVRVSLHLESDSATGSAWTVYADDVVLGPQGVVPGAIAKPTETVTVTGSWTSNTTYAAKRWRLGDRTHYEVLVEVDGGSPTATTLTINLPSGDVIDNAKVSGTNGDILGVGTILDSGTRIYDASVIKTGTTSVQVSWLSDHTGSNAVSSTNPFSFTTGDKVVVRFDVPLENHKASAALSTTETLFSTVSTSTAAATPTGTISSSYNVAIFPDPDDDEFNLYNSSTGSWTASKNGKVDVTAHLEYSFTAEAGITSRVRVINTTTGKALIGREFRTGSTNQAWPSISGSLEVSKGDIIQVQSWNNAAAGHAYLSGGSSFSIAYRPDFSAFSVYGETDLVESSTAMASYSITSSQWGDFASITLTPGEWDIEVLVSTNNFGAVAAGVMFAGIGTVSGNTGPGGGSEGPDYLGVTVDAASNTRTTLPFSKRGVIVTESTTYYLKTYYSAATTNIQAYGKISARKIK